MAALGLGVASKVISLKGGVMKVLASLISPSPGGIEQVEFEWPDSLALPQLSFIQNYRNSNDSAWAGANLTWNNTVFSILTILPFYEVENGTIVLKELHMEARDARSR